MSNAGYATLTILPSARDFKKNLQKEVGGDLDAVGRSGGASAGKHFGGGFIPAMKSLVGPALGIAAGLGIGQGIKSGLQTAAFMEQAKISFETLLGSGGEAEKMLSSISAFAAKTPFELPGLTNNVRALLGAGAAAESVIPTMSALGDTNAALGGSQENLTSVVRAWTQMMGKGKVSAEEMLQITEAGVPIWSIASKAMGKPVGELQKMASEGKLLASDVLPLLEGQMNKDYGGSMAKQAQTLAGVWSTVKDTVNMATAKALQPLVPILTRVLPPAADLLARAITGTSDAIVGLASKAAPGFTVVKDAAVGLFDLFAKGDFSSAFSRAFKVEEDSPLVDFLFTVRETATSVFSELGNIFRSVAPTVTTLWTSFSPLGLLFQALQPVLPALAAAFGQLGSTIGSVLGVAVVTLQPVISQLVSTLSGVFVAIMPAVVAMVTVLGNAFTQLTPVILSVVMAIAPLISSLLSQLAPIITSFVSSVMPPLVSIFGNVVNAIGPLIQVIAGLLVPVIQALMPVVVTVFTVVANVVSSAMRVVQSIIQVVTSAIRGDWTGVWSGIQNYFGNVWDLITSVVRGAIQIVGSVISGGLNAARSVVGSVLGAIGSFFSATWNGITSTVSGAFSVMVTAVGGGIGNVLGVIGSLPGQALGAISGIVGSFSTIGGQMIAGLANGIRNAAGMIRDAVAGAIGNVVDFAKSLLGIHSPSRVFMAIGDFTAKGMAIGLTRGAKYVLKASDALIPKTPSYTAPTVTPGGLQGALAGAGAGSSQPTIVQENHFNTPMDEETVAELSARKLLRAGVGR